MHVQKEPAFDDVVRYFPRRVQEERRAVQTPRDPALIRSRFMKGLGTGRDGALDA
jgi:hypothetical protein